MTRKLLKFFSVTYLVKYSERWCADEVNWIEHEERVSAMNVLHARRIVRSRLDKSPRTIRGRHVTTKPVLPTR